MTEDEAKTKWCPFFRPPTRVRAGFESGAVSGDIAAHCIGSGCMAWRVESGDVYAVGDRISHRAVRVADVGVWKESGWEIDDLGGTTAEYVPMVLFATKDSPPPGGYCGLAGRL